MRTMSFLLLVLVLHNVGVHATPPPQRAHGGDIPWVTLDAAEAEPRTAPMLVYFGAEWCAPCKVLETQVFNQPDVIAAMRGLVPVYVDGDSEGALQRMERFDVRVFPTLVVIDPAGEDLGRFIGSSEKSEMLEFLREANAAESAMALLEEVALGKSLSRENWQTLSTLQVQEADFTMAAGEQVVAQLRSKRGKLAKAVDAARAQPGGSEVAPVLGIKLLLIDSFLDKPSDAIPTHRQVMDQALEDAGTTRKVRLELIQYAESFLDYLEPEGAGRKRLARRMLRALEHLYGLPETTTAWKMSILLTELPLLPLASRDVDAEKTRFAERVEAELKGRMSGAERLAMVQSAARVLRRTGRELRAEAVLRETLQAHPDAYYLVGLLARYAELRGDAPAALDLAKRSYELSLPRTNGLGYGTAWLETLIKYSPAERTTIADLVDALLDAAAGMRDPYRAWGAETMKGIANSLGLWMVTDEKHGAPVSQRITGKFRALCAALDRYPVQAAACRRNLTLLTNPEPPPAST